MPVIISCPLTFRGRARADDKIPVGTCLRRPVSAEECHCWSISAAGQLRRRAGRRREEGAPLGPGPGAGRAPWSGLGPGRAPWFSDGLGDFSPGPGLQRVSGRSQVHSGGHSLGHGAGHSLESPAIGAGDLQALLGPRQRQRHRRLRGCPRRCARASLSLGAAPRPTRAGLALTGRQPYPADTVFEAVKQVMGRSGPPPEPSRRTE